ncbi:MAG: hypothetical protein ACXWHF_09835, partial [Chthoniobacterales bacterium]
PPPGIARVRWSNSDAGLGQQAIGLGNINFTVVPEANPLWPIVGLLAAVGARRVLRPPKSRRED